MSRRPSAFLYQPGLAEREYSPRHPFKPVRARLALELARGRGYLDHPWMEVVEPAPASPALFSLVHTEDYLGVLERASAGKVDARVLRYGLGMEECPLFAGLWDYCRETVGLVARGIALLLDEGRDLVFSPAGGMHHALPDMATGFCYVNDVAIACRLAADRGLKVAYLDLDAHHGNGVQEIFWEDPRVLVVSLHQTGRTLYPWSGFGDEIGAGAGLGTTLNLPLEPDTDDRTFLWAYRNGARPAIRAFAPDILVVELGADTLSVDPLSNLRLTNNGIVDAVQDFVKLAPKVFVTGGGGYDLKATTRAWALAWAVMNDVEPVSDAFAGLGGVFLGEEQLLGGSLRDMNIYMSGPDHERVQTAAERAVAEVREKVFPLLGVPVPS